MILSTEIFSQAHPLNGEWQFTIDSTASFNIENVNSIESWRTAIVPMSWQAQFSDLRDYQGVAWYKKRITLPEIKKSEAVIIKFDAVDYVSKVYVNSKLAGEHEGGYTPFEYDITPLVKEGENEIVIRVMDPEDTETGTEGISYWNIPHGKQNWYVQTSGLWQGANIEVKPSLHVKKFHLTPSIDGNIDVDITLSRKSTSAEELTFNIVDPSGKEIFSVQKNIQEGDSLLKFNASVPAPLLWSFNSPNLYTASITFGDNKVSDKFGFRSIEAKDKKLYLNKEPFYLMGALDQDFYAETIYSTPSEEFIRDEMIKAKKLGLNMLRCHIKVPDPVYLKVADEVGLLIWYEVPNWDVFSPEAAKRGEITMDRMLERDWNHPSIVILSIINESWGIDLQKEEQRKWLIKEYDRVKAKAKGRLVVDNSACWGNFHVKTDLNDYHTYSAIPENRANFEKSVRDLASRHDGLFSKFGDSHETGNEPLLLSEFGNWGLPKLPENLPWWFSRPFMDIENIVSLPAGVQQRFKDYKYDKIFGSYNELAEESQRTQFASLKYEIESIRLQNEIQGYVITEFTDINWESNGLLDMWRNFKIYHEQLAKIQQQDVIIPRPNKYNFIDGEYVEISIWVSHYSNIPFNDLSIRWNNKSGESGEMMIQNIERTKIEKVNTLTLLIRSEEKLRTDTFNFELIDAQGKVLAKNYCEIYIYPVQKEFSTAASVYEHSNDLQNLKTLLSGSNENSTIISNGLDENIINELRNGKNVICFVDSNTKAPESFPFKFQKRDTDWYDGNWASNFNWLRTANTPFEGLQSRLGFEIAEVKPQYIITGINSENFEDVISGMYVGWIQLNSGYVVQMNAGKGKLLLCSLPVHQQFKEDPFSAWFLNKLLEYAGSENFKPNLKCGKAGGTHNRRSLVASLILYERRRIQLP